MKFRRFVTVKGLFAGNTRVSVLSNNVGLVLEFFTAGKKRTVGTDNAVNCHGISFSAASMVTKLTSFIPSSECVFSAVILQENVKCASLSGLQLGGRGKLGLPQIEVAKHCLEPL